MASLPDQFTAEELEERLDQTLERLRGQEIPEAGVSVRAVRGGTEKTSARGAALVKVTSERVVDLPFFARTASIKYEGLPSGHLQVRTSPARLIKIGPRWREEGLEGPWSTRHHFERRAGEDALVFQVPDGEALAALPPEPEAGLEEPKATYEIPPAATKIRGTGVVRYLTGQTMEIGGEALLRRPLADGTLGVRPGGVYAAFESTQRESTPKALIGTRWTPLLPSDENQ